MNKYIIITESGADLLPSMINEHEIQALQMHVALGDDDFYEGAVSIDEICNYYEKTGDVPKTASVSPHDYKRAYEKIAAENPDAIIIHIAYSKKLSGSFQNSIIADEGLIRSYHIDSKNVTIGQSFTIMKAIRLIETHPEISPDELVERIKEYADLVKFLFVPGNLAFLRAGGRVSNAQYLGASILNLKPLIEVIDGEMLSKKKYRGSMKSVVIQMITDFLTKFDIDKSEIYLIHACDLDEDIKAAVESTLVELGVKDFLWHKAGGVITSHSGPGGIGIAGIKNK